MTPETTNVDEQLLEMAEQVITPELEEKSTEIIKSLLESQNLPFDISHLSAFLEGVRLVSSQVRAESENEVSVLVMALLRVKKNLQDNGGTAL